ncbi:glycoside hydrolase [Lactarius deliciosus]|nr:glycoside hydrolase [Lactarius deliciosus]
MALSLVSILSVVALAYAWPHTARSAFEKKAVIVQMFEWDWDSIAAECTSFLGPAVSPAQEHVQGPEWWTDYQPVSYILTSKRGAREQYENMIHTCHAAGVGVIADTIWNHMTAHDSGKGVAGSDFTHYDYPGIYKDQDFHHCGLEPNDTIVDFDNKVEVWTCELGGLADLETETDYVRGRLAEYTNDLISLGVDGLRLDAAKHMDPDDIADILSRLTSQPYVTQEVIWGEEQPVTPDLYTGNGDVQEFRYTSALRDAFLGLDGGISSLEDLDSRGWVAGSSANAFVSNHDTERNKGSLNVYSPSNAYTLASVFSLYGPSSLSAQKLLLTAHPYGRVSVLTSYGNFFNTDTGAPNLGAGSCNGSPSADGWLCQHRWLPLAGMVGIPESSWQSTGLRDGSPRRPSKSPLHAVWTSQPCPLVTHADVENTGSDGFVAINHADSAWNTTFMTGLPGGSYLQCHRWLVVPRGYSAPGPRTFLPPIRRTDLAYNFAASFTIGPDGSMTVTVGAHQAIAVHTACVGLRDERAEHDGARASAGVVQRERDDHFWRGSRPPPNIFVVGNVPGLGNLDPTNAIPLDPTNHPLWVATAYLPPNTAFQYSFIRKEPNGTVISESAPAREDITPASGILSIVTSWR